MLHSQSFSPRPWPTDLQFRPATIIGQSVNDPAVKDPSNGGTSPQGYVNISSGTTDESLPSMYYYYDGTNVFIRVRTEGNGLAYTAGSVAGSTDPWSSAQWTLLIDVNGDGWRDFAIHVDGASGSPSAPNDIIRVLYSNLTTSQTVDPANIQ